MIDLTDTRFIIPVRIDSIERLDNLVASVRYLLKNFDTHVYICESSSVLHDFIITAFSDLGVKFKGIYDIDPVFYRTKIINEMVMESSEKYLGIWDADVVLNIDQIVESIGILRDADSDVVFPYDGRFLDIYGLARLEFINSLDITIIEKRPREHNLIYGNKAVGGAFFINAEAYRNSGMENTNFYGWGPEDTERVKRWEILGLKIRRIDGPLYHLNHPRSHNSGYFNSEFELRNKRELLRICRMSKLQLMKEVQGWRGSYL